MSCPECAIARGESLPLGLAPVRRGSFLVHPKPEPGAHPGWLLVVPERHLENVADLTSAEARELGPLLQQAAAALSAETACAKAYVASFAEAVPHLHFHVIARAPEAPEETRGAQAFLAPASATNEADRAQLMARVLTRLRKDSELDRFRPLLLSALLWPGAGQIADGRRPLGWSLVGAAVLGLSWLVHVLFVETLARLPEDPTLYSEPAMLLTLARGLARDVLPALSPSLWVLFGIWLVGVIDAAVQAARQRSTRRG